MMRIVLDTNQLVQALMRPANLATFLMAWQSKRFTIIAAPELLNEYHYVLQYPDVAPWLSPESLRNFYSHLISYIEIVNLPTIAPICRDPGDDKVIATAIHGQADYLLTLDGDLLTREITTILHNYGVHMSTTDDLLHRLDQIAL